MLRRLTVLAAAAVALATTACAEGGAIEENVVRPGITGVSQVAGLDMSEPERLAAMDATYLRDMSVGGDVLIILQTLLAVFRRRNAIGDAAYRGSQADG